MTALEWFFNRLQKMEYFIGNDMLEAYIVAKEMEYKQTMVAMDKGIELERNKSLRPSFRERNGLTTSDKKITLAQQLNIKEFPFVIKDNRGNIIYRENSDWDWCKMEYDYYGNKIYRENNYGYWVKKEYDDKGKEIYSEDSNGVVFNNKLRYEFEQMYKQIKSECELPVAVLTYTLRDLTGVLHPFHSIAISFRDDDEVNIKKMMDVKKTHRSLFMFFNNSTEGKEFWKNNPITITPKQ